MEGGDEDADAGDGGGGRGEEDEGGEGEGLEAEDGESVIFLGGFLEGRGGMYRWLSGVFFWM